jgi:hypothetical protein
VQGNNRDASDITNAKEKGVTMRIAIWLFISVFSLTAHGQVKVAVDTVKKDAAEKYLKSEHTEKCAFTYFFVKEDLAVSRSLCAVNMSYGGGVNENIFCELVQIDLNTGKFDSFFGEMAKFMRQSGVADDLKVKGKCGAETLNNLISKVALEDVQDWSKRGFVPVVVKDSINFRDSFESKIKTYLTSTEKKNEAPAIIKAGAGWVFKKMKSSQIFERFKPCERVNSSFEGHIKNESDMWSGRGAVCGASSFYNDHSNVFECK